MSEALEQWLEREIRHAVIVMDAARRHATLLQPERLFDGLDAIHHNRPHGRGVAMGRDEGDVHDVGGARFFATLGAAEFCLLAASAASKCSP